MTTTTRPRITLETHARIEQRATELAGKVFALVEEIAMDVAPPPLEFDNDDEAMDALYDAELAIAALMIEKTKTILNRNYL